MTVESLVTIPAQLHYHQNLHHQNESLMLTCSAHTQQDSMYDGKLVQLMQERLI